MINTKKDSGNKVTIDDLLAYDMPMHSVDIPCHCTTVLPRSYFPRFSESAAKMDNDGQTNGFQSTYDIYLVPPKQKPNCSSAVVLNLGTFVQIS